ncbi:MAG: Hpt domain-containing protein [Nitrospirales bacterium]|nr:Hpt domain-containing protein [Nitrospirales bacterium]
MKNMTQQRPSDDRLVIHADPDLADLIPGFLENRRKDVAAMLAALGTGDLQAVRVLGHSMKGAGGGYGFDAITDIGGALELAANSADREEIRKQIGELSTYLDQVEVIYD